MRLQATSLTPKEREGSGLRVPQPLPLGQLGFDLFDISKFLIQFPLEEGFILFFLKSWGNHWVGEGSGPKVPCSCIRTQEFQLLSPTVLPPPPPLEE